MSKNQRPRSFGHGTSASAPGVASRTPISFGSILRRVVHKITPDFKEEFNTIADDYLLNIYKRPLGRDWSSFLMFQGARRRGQFTVEIGIGRRKEFPYFLNHYKPDHSVDSIRERLAVLVFVEDKWWTYNSERDLESQLETVMMSHVGSGLQTLVEQRWKSMEVELEHFQQRIQEIINQTAEKRSMDSLVVFTDTEDIKETMDFIMLQNKYRSYHKMFSGEIQARMENPKFMLVHSKLMSDIINRPDIRYHALSKGTGTEYRDDQIYFVSGRISQQSYSFNFETEKEQILTYGYLKSLSALESIIGIEKEKKENKIES